MHNKKIHIFGGGTIELVRPHLALTAPAYGATMRQLAVLYREMAPDMVVVEHPTRMADHDSPMVSNDDVRDRVLEVIEDPDTQIVVFSTAMCDFKGTVGDPSRSGDRLESRDEHMMHLRIADKVIKIIREKRKDIFLVGFKTTAGDTSDEQFRKGLRLMKTSHCNLVLANDVVTRNNMIITPEEVRYHETPAVNTHAQKISRQWVLRQLVDISLLRSHLTFTRSTVVAAEPVPWLDPQVPASLRTVVDFCIEQGAYKVGPTGSTVGHFACKIGPTTFLTSRRKTNFNDLANLGLVKVETDGPDSVIAYGSKPSVGGQSQRIIFGEHPEMDCVAHAHVPMRPDAPDAIPVVSQREYECGSHQCGQNTSSGLKQFGNLKAVMLDKHGPNIVFHHTVDPQEVIDFIDRNFDLARKTT